MMCTIKAFFASWLDGSTHGICLALAEMLILWSHDCDLSQKIRGHGHYVAEPATRTFGGLIKAMTKAKEKQR